MDLPFLPIRCFRDFFLYSSDQNPAKIFQSSGSSGNKRSQHAFSSEGLRTYKKNSAEGFRSFLRRHNFCIETTIVLSLVPPPQNWPTSSLSAMISMFQEEGLCIHWCNIENSVENFLEALSSMANHTEVIIFGTTFHHLKLCLFENFRFQKECRIHFQRLSISLIDTGGTKGRTRAYSVQETKDLFNNFFGVSSYKFFSEYGMCELSSQAWSAHTPHDGYFICHSTMYPFALDLQKQKSLQLNQSGFLAFFDSTNENSWPTIITEDVGTVCGDREFLLLGRAPDASIKGCSLNVSEFYTDYSSKSEEKFPTKSDEVFVCPSITHFSVEGLLQYLKFTYHWDDDSLFDLSIVAQSCHENIPVLNQFNEKKILIISSANTPIPWLFPFLIAARSDAISVVLRLPSLRSDDYFSSVMRKKTNELWQAVISFFPTMSAEINNSGHFSLDFSEFDVVVAFGSDETMNKIKSTIQNEKTFLIPKGTVRNSYLVNVNRDCPAQLASLCSLWLGRGCMTPLALFFDSNSKSQDWIDKFQYHFSKEFERRMAHYPVDNYGWFSHAHSALYTQSCLEQLGIQFKMNREAYTCVIDCREIKPAHLSAIFPDLSFAGGGFIYLFSDEIKSCLEGLQTLDILPRIQEWSLF